MPQGNPNYPRRPVPKYSTWPAGDPRRKLLRSASSVGPAVLTLPIVITVGVNGITGTAANVVGSVNPNGSATSWWIAYGTTLPLSPGTPTASAAIGSGTTPITVTFELSGLITGTTYYVAVVGQSAAGTVYGQTVSFVAQSVTTTTQPPAPFGQPFVTIPHFNVPFSLVTSGTQSGAIVVEQDTVEEVLAAVNTVVFCGIGQCAQLPAFGRPGTTFDQGPPDTTELVAAIQLWEPRASESAIAQLLPDGQTWGITLETSVPDSQGV